MNIPGLSEMTKDEQWGLYFSQPIEIPLLNGQICQIGIEGYDEDPQKDDFHTAILNLLSASPSVLKDAEPYIYQYYQDIRECYSEIENEFVPINSPADLWRHIQLGSEPIISRRSYGDQRIYVSLECNCDWERERGLQIVFKEGSEICKVGQFDGHLTNADETLENVIYRA